MTALTLVIVNLVLLFFLKALCLTLGFLVVRMGNDLLIRGISGEFKFSASLSGTKADIASASPGVLFLALGVALMAYGIGVSKTTDLTLPAAAREQLSGAPDVSLPEPDESASPNVPKEKNSDENVGRPAADSPVPPAGRNSAK